MTATRTTILKLASTVAISAALIGTSPTIATGFAGDAAGTSGITGTIGVWADPTLAATSRPRQAIQIRLIIPFPPFDRTSRRDREPPVFTAG